MNKKIRSAVILVLLVGLLTALILPAFAAEAETKEKITGTEIHIRSMDDFLDFARHCVRDQYSQNMTVYLETDLDFTDISFAGIPIFSGIFQGNLHTIQNLNLTAEGSDLGFFRYLTEDAAVYDLILQGAVLPEGSRNEIGALAGSNAGLLHNCRFHGEVAGNESVGGLVGINQITGILENCSVTGTICGAHFVGGCVGTNLGILRSCRNRAGVNIHAEDNSIETVTLSPEFIMGKETAATVTDLGGLAGNSTGVIRNCINTGSVGYPHMGYNVGGIAGSQRGYIADCKNYGTIQGRKEVAGIAGQMEPVAKIHYTPDTLQILRGQLATTATLANRASSNIRGGADEIGYEISALHDQAGIAMDAVGQLFPSADGFPDWDSVIAANNALSSSISSMQNIASSLHGSVKATVSTAAGDIQGITREVTAMSHTLDSAAENLGGTIVDVSDSDKPDDFTGKVEACENYGDISGDLNIGGITGSVSWENDKDPDGDFEVTGDRSLNFDSELRAVILDSRNQGTISAKKKNAGGIAGNMTLGLVKNSINTGLLDCEDADFIGGITGTSNGYIRGCSSKCMLLGNAYLGGIAGQATIVSDCRSMVDIREGREKQGSIIGNVVEQYLDNEEDTEDAESPVSGNYYLPLADHLGAIDGIDYYEIADSLTRKQFLALDDLSDIFKKATLRFSFPDGNIEELTVPLGELVPGYKIPRLPQKAGYISRWTGLDDIDLDNVFLDATLEVEFIPCYTSVQSDLTRENGKPILLAEGKFGATDSLVLTASEEKPSGAVEGWKLPNFRTDEDVQVHLSIPENLKIGSAKVQIQDKSGSWRLAETTEDGSYLVFTVTSEDQAVVVFQGSPIGLREILLLVGCVLVVLVAVILVLLRKKKKKSKNKTK